MWGCGLGKEVRLRMGIAPDGGGSESALHEVSGVLFRDSCGPSDV